MAEADDFISYEIKVREIQRANKTILDGFEAWLRQSNLSKKTIKDHVNNIHFFTQYQVFYEFSLRRLDEADSGDVYSFLEDWFPRKALWASVTSMKVYLASFKKFFKWMGETGLVSPETVADVLDTLKCDRDTFLAKVAEWECDVE